MRIVRQYLLNEYLAPFGIALGFLTSVFLMGYLFQLAHWVINKGIDARSLLVMFVYYIPVLVGYTLPFAVLAGLFMAFHRLGHDNELIALRTAGVSPLKLMQPFLALGLLLSLLLLWLNTQIIPEAYHQQKIRQKNLGLSNPAALLEAGVFIKDFEGQILFIHRIEDNLLYDVTIYQPQPEGRPTRTIVARMGEFVPLPDKNQILIKLMDGASDEVDAANPNNFYKLDFKTMFITLTVNQNRPQTVNKKPKAMSLRELQDEIHHLESRLVDTTPLVTELHRKLAWSFSPIVFIWLGFPLAVTAHRRSRQTQIVWALAVGIGYYLASLAAEGLSLEKKAPVGWILWAPNLTAFVVGGWLNWSINRRR